MAKRTPKTLHPALEGNAPRVHRPHAHAAPAAPPWETTPVHTGDLAEQVLQLRINGLAYPAIAAHLSCPVAMVKKLLEEAVAARFDTDPKELLAIHWARLEALHATWAVRAQEGNPQAAKIVLETLGMQQHLAPWLAHLPGRRGAANDQDFYAEAKAILMEPDNDGGSSWRPALPSQLPVMEDDEGVVEGVSDTP